MIVDVLCIGHAAYDVTLPLNKFPKENEKYSISDKFECGGGPASNAAFLLSKWGIKTEFIGILGDDIYGKKIITEFKNIGTIIENCKVLENYDTPFSSILVNKNNGSRTIINSKSSHNPLTLENKNLQTKNPRVLLFDGHELEASLEAMEIFPSAITVLDAGSYNENTHSLAKKVDYLITSERFALDFTEMDSLKNQSEFEECIEKLTQINNNNIIVTLGENGLIYNKNNNKVKKLNSIKTKTIDTTGAGDIFHGAFVYGLLNDYSLEDNLYFSSLTSSISVESFGGRTSIPELSSVFSRLKKGNHN